MSSPCKPPFPPGRCLGAPLAALLLGITAAGSATAAQPAAEPAAEPALSSHPAALQPTATLREPPAIETPQIILELGRRRLSLVDHGKVMGSWPVAIGDPATPTPTGSFRVLNKVVNPQYQSTKSGKINATVGPNGPLGDRWIGFHSQGPNQFGIHGTPALWAWSVRQGAAVTHGCVRMLGDHVRALFDRVSVGTPVIVRQ
jgi:lipoprotein-anchoring transpeptidase ErfK/SrfK